jgi:hypothetical protein
VQHSKVYHSPRLPEEKVAYGEKHDELEDMSSSLHAISFACDLQAKALFRSGTIYFSATVINPILSKTMKI